MGGSSHCCLPLPSRAAAAAARGPSLAPTTLAHADPAVRRKRKAKGGNTGKNFTEGWVEFEDKGRAKEVVAMLNGQPMGGRWGGSTARPACLPAFNKLG